ncbi:hypothetical protein MTX35_18245 [Rhodococcus sp. ARC_M12]|uniref:hypothetical protein n=1 Tax=Rhodococcus sp. ARC_M12 TaxID=2928854 RepID=UPI001FB484D3|nr:hypothetical protein [Rhodococcus sp. ARC_M12]MCJ0979656.1 hypothetical protein [Rhodococcus sp. ARC_M12]
MRTDMRRGGVWMDVAVVVAIVSVGTVVAGVLEGQRPTVGPIPGCDVVLPAEEGFSFSIGSYGGRYDNPDYPWLTATKASALSTALIESLPADVELEFAPPSNSLVFQPMQIYPEGVEIAEGVTVEDISGDSTASGVVGRGDVLAPLVVSVEEWDGEIPPCVEERVDERTTLPDGTVVDTLDAVSDSNGRATHRRTAVAYFTDTLVHARTSNEGSDSLLPLEVDEVRSIVSNPELRVTAEVPEGTPPPPRDCGSYRENPTLPLSKNMVERIGASLADQWAVVFPDTQSDRPIGDLVLGSSGTGSACTTVNVSTPTGSTELSIEISIRDTSGRRNTGAQDSPGVSRLTLPDGTVVTRRSDDTPMGGQSSEWLSVLRPSNTLVQFSFGDGIEADSLVELATAPGLDL